MLAVENKNTYKDKYVFFFSFLFLKINEFFLCFLFCLAIHSDPLSDMDKYAKKGHWTKQYGIIS